MTVPQRQAATRAAYELGIIASILAKIANGEPGTDIGPEVGWLAKRAEVAADIVDEAVNSFDGTLAARCA